MILPQFLPSLLSTFLLHSSSLQELSMDPFKLQSAGDVDLMLRLHELLPGLLLEDKELEDLLPEDEVSPFVWFIIRDLLLSEYDWSSFLLLLLHDFRLKLRDLRLKVGEILLEFNDSLLRLGDLLYKSLFLLLSPLCILSLPLEDLSLVILDELRLELRDLLLLFKEPPLS